ncbi:hypothetical protein GK091_25360 [Spirosoma agri]|uniref:DUF3575 domain-containing protein n=1 Tax=Spirosoma agri TaxID=1987381 RepID=A0A6M0IS58_9BACT|nr:hypothetical protein [Spirosoma agri]NEU70231.1 hypothetical protein [Spirosoma agri]
MLRTFSLFTLFSTFLAIIGITTSQAQSSILQSYKWEISYDALPLINKETTAQNLTLRRFITNSKGTTALRLQLRGGSKSSEFTVASDYVYGQINLGYEWYKPVDKFLFYYGPEVSYFYQYTDTGSYKVNQMFQQYSHDRVLGFSGLFGCKYLVGKHLTIGAESKLSYSFFRSRSERTDYTFFPSTSQTVATGGFSADNSWQVGDIVGLASVNIGFIF